MVAFADLNEAAELREAREPHGNGLGGERVEDDIHAAPIGEFHHGLGEIAAARVDDMFDASVSSRARLVALPAVAMTSAPR